MGGQGLDADRLRVQLLPENHYFQKGLHEARRDLGIPDGGFPNGEALGQWMYDHAKAHGPQLISEYGPTATQHARANLRLDTETWFKWGVSSVRRRALGSLPLLGNAEQLLNSFHLPRTVLNRLVWHLLTGEEIPDTMIATTVVEEPGTPSYPLEPIEEAIYASYWEGLPRDIPGDLVVIKVLVNEYTTKKELEEAWKYIQRVQEPYGKHPARRRGGQTLDRYKSWLPEYRAHRVEGKSLFAVATDFNVPLDTLKGHIQTLDELFVRPENTTS